MNVYTIGFTKKTAEHFFGLLRQTRPKRLIDVRLNNVSQLAGFSKKDDLAFFLRELCSMDYIHMPSLAPTQDLLEQYKKGGGSWAVYEKGFVELLMARGVEATTERRLIADSCLLCSEEQPDHCHRRLVAEYLQASWGDLAIHHLV